MIVYQADSQPLSQYDLHGFTDSQVHTLLTDDAYLRKPLCL